MAVFFSCGSPAKDGIGAVGFSRVLKMAAFGSLSPIAVRGGPGPPLPFSPILWQARQPDDATAALPFSNCGATFRSIVVGDPATAPRIVRYAIAAIVRIPASVATGRWSGLRFGLRS